MKSVRTTRHAANQRLENMDEQLEELARIICRVTDNAYGASLVGNAAAATRALYDDLNDIRPGRMVVEITSLGMRSYLDNLGTLLRVTDEPVVFSDPNFIWDEKEEGRPHPTEKCTYIKTLDGREFRWTNARFIAVPDQRLR